MASLIEEDNQKKILQDYLAKLQNPDQQKKEALGLLQQGGAPYQQAYENKFAQQGFSPESMGMAGMGAIEGVKNVGNVANATDAFLANRLKKAAPMAESPAGELINAAPAFEEKAFQNSMNKNNEKYINKTKNRYGGDISQAGAEQLNRLENRFGIDDTAAATRIKKAQGFDNEMPWVSRKDLGGGPMPMPNFKTEPTGKIGKGFPLHYDQDPFQWADSTFGATKELLQKHAENGIVPEIHTASDLVGRDDYMALMPKDSKINMYITGINDDLQRSMFPGHPSDKRIIKAAKRLQENGFTNVNIVPADLTKAQLKEASSSTWSKEAMQYLDQALENNKSIQNDIGLKKYSNEKLGNQ